MLSVKKYTNVYNMHISVVVTSYVNEADDSEIDPYNFINVYIFQNIL